MWDSLKKIKEREKQQNTEAQLEDSESGICMSMWQLSSLFLTTHIRTPSRSLRRDSFSFQEGFAQKQCSPTVFQCAPPSKPVMFNYLQDQMSTKKTQLCPWLHTDLLKAIKLDEIFTRSYPGTEYRLQPSQASVATNKSFRSCTYHIEIPRGERSPQSERR